MLNSLHKVLQERKVQTECVQCCKLKKELEKSREDNARLEDELARISGGKAGGFPIGAHTPSSQIRFKKKKTTEENLSAKGGAVKGHKASGRKSFDEDATKVVVIPAPALCPSCNQETIGNGKRKRSIIDASEKKLEKVIYKCDRSRCPDCGKTYTGAVPALPKALYGNNLISQIAVMHYLHGIPLGRIGEIFGKDIRIGSVIGSLHRVAKIFEPLIPVLIQQYRESFVKQADETSWYTDGQKGWAWLFSTEHIALLLCEDTRAASVTTKVFGTQSLPGVLIVDRYAGYNKVPCLIQYCFAHILRDVTKLLKDFPDSKEVASFVEALADMLVQAMHLQKQKLSDQLYLQQARSIQSQIKIIASTPHEHLGIKDIQLIFTKNEHRLYHWVEHRSVPCHNNASEQQIRRTVISRKISFGSQSDQGAHTRSVLYSILATARKKLGSDSALEVWLADLLNAFSTNHNAFDVLNAFHSDPSS